VVDWAKKKSASRPADDPAAAGDLLGGERAGVPFTASEQDTAAKPAGPAAQVDRPPLPSRNAAGLPGVACLGVLWAAGTVLVLLSIVRARLLLRRFRGARTMADPAPLCRQVADLAQRLGIRRPVRLLAASGLKVPVAFGLRHPTLMVPASFEEDFDRRQQETILAHELAHLAARDPAWQILAAWAVSLSARGGWVGCRSKGRGSARASAAGCSVC
jgi:beta-lactamase regulating signal transducer with metallopeptidase domain